MRYAILLLLINGVAAAAPPNFVLITVDDMNCDSVGVFGCAVDDITPNIDRLASQGMRFERAHVTIAICQPTRAVWMTGRYPHRNGALGFDPIRPDVPTLLETLHDAGYVTGILAKERHVIPTRKAAWDVTVPGSKLRNGRGPKRYYHHSKKILERAKQAGKPFFLMANSQDPHRPFAGSPQERQRRLKPKSGDRDFPDAPRQYETDEVTVPGFLPDLPAVRKEMAEYYSSVHRADQIVGEVLRALRESGQEDNTIVMFLSDHGMPLPFAKTNCWYHSTRTPWIVRWPGTIKAGAIDGDHFVSGIDLAPTVLEALGLPALPDADGRSFLALLRGETQEGRDDVITHINRTSGRREFPMRSVIDSRFGYIFNGWADTKTRFRNESQNGRTMNAMIRAAESDAGIADRVKLFLYRTPEEFYVYKNDPDALHNLIEDANYKVEIDRLRGRLLETMRRTHDPQLRRFEAMLAPDEPQVPSSCAPNG